VEGARTSRPSPAEELIMCRALCPWISIRGKNAASISRVRVSRRHSAGEFPFPVSPRILPICLSRGTDDCARGRDSPRWGFYRRAIFVEVGARVRSHYRL
jgi:hypothetical protein